MKTKVKNKAIDQEYLDSNQSKIELSIKNILSAIGEDPLREGLVDTPKRVAKMYLEIFGGLNENPSAYLQTQFCADQHHGIVIVKDIRFTSMCEHHLLPFVGNVHVAYVPQAGCLAGLSKFARVVNALSRRPQLQERLTNQICEAVNTGLDPLGVLVLVEAEHMCMAMRGIKSPNSTTITMVSTGVLETNSENRSEALTLIKS